MRARLRTIFPQILLIIILIPTLYIWSVNNRFFGDDEGIFSTMKQIKNSPSHLLFIPSLLVNTTYFINFELFGYNPVGYHLTNILLFIISAIVVYFFFGEIDRENAFTVTLIYIVFPLNSEVVSYVWGRPYIIFSIFLFLTLYFFVKAERETKFMKYTLSIIFTTFTSVAAPFSISLPLIIIAIKTIYLRNIRNGWLRIVPYLLTPVLMTVFWSGAYLPEITETKNKLISASTAPFIKPLFLPTSFFFYLESSLMLDDSSIYALFKKYNSDFVVRFNILAWLMLILIAFFVYRRAATSTKSQLFFATVLTGLSLLPTLNPLTPNRNLVTDRYAFLAGPWIAYLIYLFIKFLTGTKILASKISHYLIIVVTIFAIKTFLKNFSWYDNRWLILEEFVSRLF